MRPTGHILAILMAMAGAGAAQDATGILNRTAESYRHIQSWDIEQSVVAETRGAAASRTERRERYAVVEGKHRWEQGDRLSIADGQSVWTYSSQTNQYSKRDQGPVDAGPLPMGYWTPDAQPVKSARVVREETVTVDGAAWNCYVVEIAHDATESLVRGMPAAPPETWWIDKDRYLVLKQERRTSPIYKSQQVWTTTLTKLQINQPVADSVFQFVPPAGAKLEVPPRPPAPPPAAASTPAKKKKK
jgi:outer membrane lipoprotein-sorting protein